MKLQDRHRTARHQAERDALARYVLLLREAHINGACGTPRIDRIRRMEARIEDRHYLCRPEPAAPVEVRRMRAPSYSNGKKRIYTQSHWFGLQQLHAPGELLYLL